MIDEEFASVKRTIDILAYNDMYGRRHEEIPSTTLQLTEIHLDRARVYTFGISACNDLRSDSLGHIDGGGCGPETVVKIIPRIPFPKPSFLLIDVDDFYPNNPSYLDYTFLNSEKPAGKVTFEIPAPIDTDLILTYRIYAN